MDCDDLSVEMLAHDDSVSSPVCTADGGTDTIPRDVGMKRARLAALAAGGQAKLSFKGRPVNSERVDNMSDAQIEELYSRHEARLGAAMTKSLGSTLLRMYASVTSVLLPLPSERQTALVADLKEDSFVSSALCSACYELYYRYGMYRATLTAALTTASITVLAFSLDCYTEELAIHSTSSFSKSFNL